MITPEIIQRINELAKKQKESGLTPEEKNEQTALRRLYLDSIKGRLKEELAARNIKPKQAHHVHGPHCTCHHH
ncbi:MAG: DUF896 domain-containing protein [Sporomusaceae bacterium]|nr:DUF896 domain-containing protein [Sporomusaceae bacterium]